MNKLSFKRYLRKKKKIVFYLSRKIYDYLYDYYEEYVEYCNINNYEYEDLESDYNEAIGFKELENGTYKIPNEILNCGKNIPTINEHGERWSEAIDLNTNEPIYGLDVPSWLEDEYKSFCENITTDKINNGVVFMRISGKGIFKVISYIDYVFTLENGAMIDLIKEGINEMEKGYPSEIYIKDENNNSICMASYGMSIEIGRFGYDEILVFTAKDEYLDNIIKLCNK